MPLFGCPVTRPSCVCVCAFVCVVEVEDRQLQEVEGGLQDDDSDFDYDEDDLCTRVFLANDQTTVSSLTVEGGGVGDDGGAVV